MPQVFFTHDSTGLDVHQNANILVFANGQLLHEYLQEHDSKNPHPGQVKLANGEFSEPWRIVHHEDGNLPPETIAPFTLEQVRILEPDGGQDFQVWPNVNVKVVI